MGFSSSRCRVVWAPLRAPPSRLYYILILYYTDSHRSSPCCRPRRWGPATSGMTRATRARGACPRASATGEIEGASSSSKFTILLEATRGHTFPRPYTCRTYGTPVSLVLGGLHLPPSPLPRPPVYTTRILYDWAVRVFDVRLLTAICSEAIYV